MIQFKYFSSAEAEQFTFYRIPKLLFTSDIFRPLSCEAKVLYGLMLDRVSLSMKNGWKDEEDRVYIIYAITDICEQLGCGRQKAFKLLAELDMETGIGLIERKRRGLGKENLIYVKSFVINEEKNQKALSSGEASFTGDLSGTEDSEEPVHTEDTDLHALKEGKSQKYENHTSGNMSTETDDYAADKKENTVSQKYENHTSGSMKNETGTTGPQKYENHTSGSTEIILPEVRKSYPNKTNNNKTNKSDTEILSIYPIIPSISGMGKDGMDNKDVDESKVVYDATVEIVRENTGYEALCGMEYDCDQIDGIIAIIADILTSKRKSMMIGGERIPMWKLQKRMRDIDMPLMQYVLECLENNSSGVRNVRKYLIATLYNAPTTISTYYQQAVNCDMGDFEDKRKGEYHDD